jgi:hypothetical protein
VDLTTVEMKKGPALSPGPFHDFVLELCYGWPLTLVGTRKAAVAPLPS